MPEIWILTGGIGSGKSTVRRMLADLGATTIDADAVGHAALEPGGPAAEAVAARWPEILVDGMISRPVLAGIVFSDPRALAELESITHPVIAAELVRRATEVDGVVIVEISVPRDLMGVGRDRTIVTTLPPEIRIQRLLDRGMDPTEIERRITSQPSPEEWEDLGSIHLSTEGDLEDVRMRVKELWSRLTG